VDITFLFGQLSIALLIANIKRMESNTLIPFKDEEEMKEYEASVGTFFVGPNSSELVSRLLQECQVLDSSQRQLVISKIGTNGYVQCMKLLRGINSMASEDEFKKLIKKLDDEGLVIESKSSAYEKKIVIREWTFDPKCVEDIKAVIPLGSLKKMMDIVLSFFLSNVKTTHEKKKVYNWQYEIEEKKLFQKELIYLDDVGLVQGIAVKVWLGRKSDTTVILGLGGTTSEFTISIDVVQLTPVVHYLDDKVSPKLEHK